MRQGGPSTAKTEELFKFIFKKEKKKKRAFLHIP